MARKPKVSDKELIKWANIIGAEKFIWLYIEDKIALTSAQLDKVIDIKNGRKVERVYSTNRYRSNGNYERKNVRK